MKSPQRGNVKLIHFDSLVPAAREALCMHARDLFELCVSTVQISAKYQVYYSLQVCASALFDIVSRQGVRLQARKVHINRFQIASVVIDKKGT